MIDIVALIGSIFGIIASCYAFYKWVYVHFLELRNVSKIIKKMKVIDNNGKDRLVVMASRYRKDTVIKVLDNEINKRIDPVQRYWIYIALGEIGGEKAEFIIKKKGLLDVNEFARHGAESILRNQRS